jgi:hypothetical protein
MMSPTHELIGDPTYADAILDRLIHNAHRINLSGHNLRRSCVVKALQGVSALWPTKSASRIKEGGTDIAAPSQKTHQRPSYGLLSQAIDPGCCQSPAQHPPIAASRSLRYSAI